MTHKVTFHRKDDDGESHEGELYARLDGQRVATIRRRFGTPKGYYGAYGIGTRLFASQAEAKAYLRAKYETTQVRDHLRQEQRTMTTISDIAWTSPGPSASCYGAAVDTEGHGYLLHVVRTWDDDYAWEAKAYGDEFVALGSGSSHSFYDAQEAAVVAVRQHLDEVQAKRKEAHQAWLERQPEGSPWKELEL